MIPLLFSKFSKNLIIVSDPHFVLSARDLTNCYKNNKKIRKSKRKWVLIHQDVAIKSWTEMHVAIIVDSTSPSSCRVT